jgi:hypothetical protein
MSNSGFFSQQKICDKPEWPYGRNCNKLKYHRKMIPERFIVICPEGHIDDFPVVEWIHDESHPYNPKTCRIRRSTGGKSASLTGVFYECTCGAKRSLQGATMEGALAKIGYKCRGTKPWLGIEEDKEHPCGRTDVKVVQRGGTNVWFADIKSSIYIPIEADESVKRLQKVAEDLYPIVKNHKTNDGFERSVITALARSKRVDPELLYKAIVAVSNNEKIYNEISENISEEEFRIAEYNVLNKSSGSDDGEFHSISYDISKFDPRIRIYFDNISLVPKLRETRAFVGFSRLEPNETKSISEKKKELRIGSDNWLPAIQVFGEGVFFQFNNNALEKWIARNDVRERIKKLNASYKRVKKETSISLNAKYVLIHTFAHLVINQLSYNCGYGSSSIRERIYCGETNDSYNMHGVLLYTASGDSEGSMGGLVRQGRPGIIEPVIIMAIENALWCSSDPVCIQSSGQGPDNCNLAACHNCALLPETCCENGNRLLDRGLLAGTIDNREMGYFYNIINYQEII